jgi:hypothetical protein
MVSLLAAVVLAGTPVHGGAALGFGLGAPFSNANAGFQMSVKALVDVGVADKLTVGAVLPVGFGFFSQGGPFGSSASYTVVDVMPGFRGTVAVLDWIHAAVELGLGPSIINTRVSVFGSSGSQTDTYFAMRAALLVEVAPPSLAGLFFFAEPVAVHGRLDQGFSEYRFSVGVGYRR